MTELPRLPDDFPLPVVLGIDPGTRVVGYGALVVRERRPTLLAAGVLNLGSGEISGRLGSLRRQLDDLLDGLRPAVVVVEKAFAAKNIASALRVGEGRGVALACAACSGARVVEYTPAEAKKALVGNGVADKGQVARMVTHTLGSAVEGVPLDATDALALALTWVHHERLEALCAPRPPARRT